MTPLLSQIFPILYGACMLLLLYQAFKVMAKGFSAVPRPGDPGASAPAAPSSLSDPDPRGDRTGRLTIHPELLDADGQITSEDLLTVRFGGDNDSPRQPAQHD
ncbi:MAG: DUF2973 domain-containing protein [Cyanobacteria bacterium]|nr:DUF2973 domain-containing protein [Cyanobacteriota bacterium]